LSRCAPHGRADGAANNTSAFNCRSIAGQPGVYSEHSFGRAIDINPVQNPYITRSAIHPPAAARFATIGRSDDDRVPLGAIREGDIVVRAFARVGWDWGGRWPGPKDFPHFTALTR